MNQYKKCSRCHNRLPVEQFAWSNQAVNRRQSHCRDCQSKDNSQYRRENKNGIDAHNRNRRFRLRRRNQEYVFIYLCSHPCVDCGENNPLVLDFDHVRGVKLYAVSNLVQTGCKLETLQREIDKCDVRCANCHRIRTAKQLGYYSVLCAEALPQLLPKRKRDKNYDYNV